jgi:hypothetical protein
MPLRERTWLDNVLDAPLPDTSAQLLAECQELRHRLIDGKWTTAIVSRAPEVTERLWDAMRQQGGAVPRRPPLQACSEAAAFADLLLDKELLEALHRAVDAVAAWCEGRGAVGAAGGATTGAEQPEGTGADTRRTAAMASLRPAERKAYYSFRAAELKSEKQLEDREAYELLKEEGIPENAESGGELADYQLPPYASWTRYLRKARKALGEQKYTSRRERPHGKSVVERDQIE